MTILLAVSLSNCRAAVFAGIVVFALPDAQDRAFLQAGTRQPDRAVPAIDGVGVWPLLRFLRCTQSAYSPYRVVEASVGMVVHVTGVWIEAVLVDKPLNIVEAVVYEVLEGEAVATSSRQR